MQKKSTSRAAFYNLRALIGLLLCAATAYFILIPIRSGLALLHAPSNASQRTLSFEERVSYQRAIEDVYWRHRIWPRNRGERPDPKPSLDAMMSQAQLEKKVKDYLRNSQALEDYWQRPITAEQLQAEMDRMAQHTRQPEVLQELFEALGNDPFVIAECLARPALAERLVTNWYAYDQRIHGELKQRAEAELQLHPSIGQMKQLSGKYSEIELVRGNARPGKGNLSAGHSVNLDSGTWTFTGSLNTARFLHTTALLPSGIVLVAGGLDNTFNATDSAELYDSATGTWTATGNLNTARYEHTATLLPNGKVLVAGGSDSSGNASTSAELYDPVTGTWTATGSLNTERTEHTATLLPSGKVLVAAGTDSTFTASATAELYDPVSGTWTATGDLNTARNLHTATLLSKKWCWSRREQTPVKALLKARNSTILRPAFGRSPEISTRRVMGMRRPCYLTGWSWSRADLMITVCICERGAVRSDDWNMDCYR